jgi:hypothetical protein
MPGKFSTVSGFDHSRKFNVFATIFELRSKKTTMPLKKFTSRLSLLKIEEQAPFWWNEAEASFVLCPDTQTPIS